MKSFLFFLTTITFVLLGCDSDQSINPLSKISKKGDNSELKFQSLSNLDSIYGFRNLKFMTDFNNCLFSNSEDSKWYIDSSVDGKYVSCYIAIYKKDIKLGYTRLEGLELNFFKKKLIGISFKINNPQNLAGELQNAFGPPTEIISKAVPDIDDYVKRKKLSQFLFPDLFEVVEFNDRKSPFWFFYELQVKASENRKGDYLSLHEKRVIIEKIVNDFSYSDQTYHKKDEYKWSTKEVECHYSAELDILIPKIYSMNVGGDPYPANLYSEESEGVKYFITGVENGELSFYERNSGFDNNYMWKKKYEEEKKVKKEIQEKENGKQILKDL